MVGNAALCIPWKPIGDRSRDAAYEWCRNWWDSHGFDTIFVGSGSSRAEMCNNAARQALESDVDVFVFVDADTWTPPEQIHKAILMADEWDILVHAFTDYVRVGQSFTDRSLRPPPDHLDLRRLQISGRTTKKHVSGASAISLDLWNRLGGFDERFTTYGLEDRAFHLAAHVIGCGVARIDGPAFHWWHRKDPHVADRPHKDDARVQLISRYCAAAGYVPDYGALGRMGESGLVTLDPSVIPGPEAMISVLSEPGGPLSR